MIFFSFIKEILHLHDETSHPEKIGKPESILDDPKSKL
jgi:hypothetical protein